MNQEETDDLVSSWPEDEARRNVGHGHQASLPPIYRETPNYLEWAKWERIIREASRDFPPIPRLITTPTSSPQSSNGHERKREEDGHGNRSGQSGYHESYKDVRHAQLDKVHKRSESGNDEPFPQSSDPGRAQRAETEDSKLRNGHNTTDFAKFVGEGDATERTVSSSSAGRHVTRSHYLTKTRSQRKGENESPEPARWSAKRLMCGLHDDKDEDPLSPPLSPSRYPRKRDNMAPLRPSMESAPQHSSLRSINSHKREHRHERLTTTKEHRIPSLQRSKSVGSREKSRHVDYQGASSKTRFNDGFASPTRRPHLLPEGTRRGLNLDFFEASPEDQHDDWVEFAPSSQMANWSLSRLVCTMKDTNEQGSREWFEVSEWKKERPVMSKPHAMDMVFFKTDWDDNFEV